MAKAGGIDDRVRTEPPPLDNETPGSRPNRLRWLLGAVLVLALAGGGWWLIADHGGSGDPGGKILQQLSPAASALPGYGTPRLPWSSQPSTSQPYLIASEPTRDSCDGLAGTEGWSQVVVQGSFDWAGSNSVLFETVGLRLGSFGWYRMPIPGTDEAMWKKPLDNASTATATLTLSPLGPPHWEFVALAPPAGRAASGC